MNLSLLKSDIKNEIEDLNTIYLNGFYNDSKIGLYEGLGGWLLLLHQNYLVTREPKYLQELNLCVEHTVSTLEQSEDINPSFSSGLAGWGWTIQYLQDTNDTELDMEPILLALDIILRKKINNLLEGNDLDSFYGAIGIARYFLKRRNRYVISIVIGHLKKTLKVNDQGGAWISFNKNRGQDEYNFSLAHGITGILYFLNRCIKEGYKEQICIGLVQQVIKFIIANRRSSNLTESFFPGSISLVDFTHKVYTKSYTRLAWCYGDLSTLYILLVSAIKVKDCNLESKIITDLEQIVRRKDYNQTLIADSGFCHGAVGVAYMYKKIFKLTQNKVFQKAYFYWINRSLSYKNKGKDQGWTFFKGKGEEWSFEPSANLLDGNAGLVLVYTDFLYEGFDSWDECFMLDH